ncbi:MAG: methyltransferase domain-containing protein, partial [Alphaproteobacteria bacterium]|nr:methyltransferase domain-containing protein [Alphaproteobacteria bacterium]
MPRHQPRIALPTALKTLRRLLATLYTPPAVQTIEPTYHAVRQQQVLALLAKHFGKNPKYPGILLGKSLLDVGCGTAPVGCFMALAGADVTAIDPDRRSLAAAQAYAENFGTPLNFLNLRAEQLLTSPTRYQIVMALDVLASHPEPGKLMWVLRQLVAPGGVLVIGHTTRSLRAWLVHRVLSQWFFKRTPRET